MSLLDAMHEAVLAGIHPKPPREVAQTSFIYRIFGGTCRSQVTPAAALTSVVLTETSLPAPSQVCWLCNEHPFSVCLREGIAELCSTAALAVLHALVWNMI